MVLSSCCSWARVNERRARVYVLIRRARASSWPKCRQRDRAALSEHRAAGKSGSESLLSSSSSAETVTVCVYGLVCDIKPRALLVGRFCKAVCETRRRARKVCAVWDFKLFHRENRPETGHLFVLWMGKHAWFCLFMYFIFHQEFVLEEVIHWMSKIKHGSKFSITTPLRREEEGSRVGDE